MEEFREQVKKGFVACKSDIAFLKDDNEVIVQKMSSLVQENKELKSKLNETNSEINEMKAQIKAFEIALNYIKNFNQTQNSERDIISESNVPVQKPVVQRQEIKSQDPYEALLAFKAKSNKRDLLKQKMISMINQGGSNLSELKFMFVEHFKYCSKATFYNYLKELELEKHVRVQRQNTKNFVYLMNDISNEI